MIYAILVHVLRWNLPESEPVYDARDFHAVIFGAHLPLQNRYMIYSKIRNHYAKIHNHLRCFGSCFTLKSVRVRTRSRWDARDFYAVIFGLHSPFRNRSMIYAKICYIYIYIYIYIYRVRGYTTRVQTFYTRKDKPIGYRFKLVPLPAGINSNPNQHSIGFVPAGTWVIWTHCHPYTQPNTSYLVPLQLSHGMGVYSGCPAWPKSEMVRSV
jgi:hypothetical protein